MKKDIYCSQCRYSKHTTDCYHCAWFQDKINDDDISI